MMKNPKVQNRSTKNDPIIKALPLACADENTAVEFMEQQRWGNYPACPRCGSMDVYQMRGKDGSREKGYRWRCRDCVRLKETKPMFSVRTGTVFEESRVPMRHWCFAFWRASTSKKGVSALEIHRQTGVSYKSALFMLHRIRYAMAPEPVNKLSGIVEVDETYVGGKPRYKGESKRGRGTNKQAVVALVERGGNVRARPIADVSAKTLKAAIRQYVGREARIITDEMRSYGGIGVEFQGGHHTINHGIGQYVNGDIYTNTAESFFALFKRGLNGIYHAVSKKHLHRYLAHAEFLYNHRELEDGERATAAIKAADGKRLFYKEPITY